jgi:hypothetical protein
VQRNQLRQQLKQLKVPRKLRADKLPRLKMMQLVQKQQPKPLKLRQKLQKDKHKLQLQMLLNRKLMRQLARPRRQK